MKMIYQQPEAPLEESWFWQTDVIVSDDGTEQRIMLCPLPKRALKGTYGFDAVQDVRFMQSTLLTGTGDPYLLPFWHQQVRLVNSVIAGGAALAFNAERTDMRDAGQALLVARDGTTEIVAVGVVSADGCTLSAPLARNWAKGSLVMPLWPMYSSGQMSISRGILNSAGTMAIIANDTAFMSPFLSAYAESDLTMLGDIPVLDRNATGEEFAVGVDTGASWFDYGGVVENRNRWLHAQLIMPRAYLCHRVLNLADWSWWRTFADYTKGSLNPFYVPSYRDDFAITTPPAPNGVTAVFSGHDYLDSYWPHPAFKQIAIYSELGVHYAHVTAAVAVGGNTQVTFNPALPNVAGWANEQHVTLLVQCRIADDTIALSHDALETTVTLNLRTCVA